ncbi:hypothetical protein [Luteimicrobium sp. DT211]|uniref:hypothetical protein n=1 Tax=Luteimicrobium sp. DT211 TaxID=3393412 RepID=UPI003CF73124
MGRLSRGGGAGSSALFWLATVAALAAVVAAVLVPRVGHRAADAEQQAGLEEAVTAA